MFQWRSEISAALIGHARCLGLATLVSCIPSGPARDGGRGTSTSPQDRASNDPPSASRVHDSPSSVSHGSIKHGLSDLAVAGFLPAVVFVPVGHAARPLLVATHGAGGTAEDECAYWAKLTAELVFLLCLRGTPFNQAEPTSFFYRDHLELGRELESALPALRAAVGPRLAPKAGVYAGFSQGATMGVGMIAAHGAELPYLVLVEGGYDYWSVARARRYAANGGKRVLLACGTKSCAQKSEKVAGWLRQGGLEARVEYAPGVGHTPSGGVMERVAAALPWVFEGDLAWQLPWARSAGGTGAVRSLDW